ncbi:MAG: DUF2892 domain-containing protein [Lentisphaerota bacterium]
MKCNVGGVDKILRIAAGVLILGTGLFSKSWWGLAGFIPLMTGLTGFCPAYLLFGKTTCQADKDDQNQGG